jgi:phosphoglycolate phosphatase-like HAD superfamily hydrolase
MDMLNRRCALALALAFLACLAAGGTRAQPADPLPSWNDGPAKQAIMDFVAATTTPGAPGFVVPDDRLAIFDQDGTLWVEKPMYTQVLYCLDRVPAVVKAKPELANVEPFKTVLSGDKTAMAELGLGDLEKIVFATHAGMSVDAFQTIAEEWAAKAKDSRWKRPYTELVYQPMEEVLDLLRANGFRTYIVTGGGQDFVRSYAKRVYGVGPAEVIGSALATKYGYDAKGQGVLLREPKLELDNNNSGKPQDIYLFTGQRPQAAFGNTSGDRQMLEWTTAGSGKRLGMLVLHDDALREYAYGPAGGLPDTKIGVFSQALMDEAKRQGWTVISMKRDWKRIFAWEQP